MSARYAAASSKGFNAARWTFSSTACRSNCVSSVVRITAGSELSPASRAARHRRSPMTSWKRSSASGLGRTTTGCRTPTTRIEATSSVSASGSNCCRGWRGLGSIALNAISANRTAAAGTGTNSTSSQRRCYSVPQASGCDVLADDRQRRPAARRREARRRPQMLPVGADAVLLPQPTRGHALERVHQRGHGDRRRVLDQQMYVVVFAVAFDQVSPEVFADRSEDTPEVTDVVPVEHVPPVLRHKDQMDVQRRKNVSTPTVVLSLRHRPIGHSDRVLVRYRYRLDPTPAQQRQLARTFGCARWVYNECLRVRDGAHAGGEIVTDTEVQRRAVTLARQRAETAWLSEVASVPLVQACQDARRAYRNWFDSLRGQRKGRRIGHPRFRRKHGRQSIRLTRNGFALNGDQLYVAKVGDITVRWSRDLPSVPSSVTVIPV